MSDDDMSAGGAKRPPAAGPKAGGKPRFEANSGRKGSSGGQGKPRRVDADKIAARRSRERVEPEIAGLAARRMAVHLIETVLLQSHAIDDALESSDQHPQLAGLEARDRGFARLIAATVLRRLGSLDAVIARFLQRPLPAGSRARHILLVAAAQILLIGTPVHAAINLAVEQCRRDPKASRFDKLANAVLRRVAADGTAMLADLDVPRIDMPDWLWQRWCAAYGETAARAIATASLIEAPLDLSVKGEAAAWAERLGARMLDTGSLRLADGGRIEDLAGYAEGQWWVQDAAAALPARLFGPVDGLEMADLCAAPGGKTAALAAAGARVTAVDLSPERLALLAANMTRLGLADRVDMVAADLQQWSPGRVFDGVLLDAPCTSTGTIRRHPDILHLKRSGDAGRLATLQAALLERASQMVKPGGLLVYCVCSIEPEEGDGVVRAFLAAHPSFKRAGIVAAEVAGHGEWITADGDLRTLPSHSPAADQPGMDGFYAARLQRGVA